MSGRVEEIRKRWMTMTGRIPPTPDELHDLFAELAKLERENVKELNEHIATLTARDDFMRDAFRLLRGEDPPVKERCLDVLLAAFKTRDAQWQKKWATEVDKVISGTERIAELERGIAWIRVKLELAEDVPFNRKGVGPTIYGSMHVVCAQSKSFVNYCAEHKAKEAELAKLRAENGDLRRGAKILEHISEMVDEQYPGQSARLSVRDGVSKLRDDLDEANSVNALQLAAAKLQDVTVMEQDNERNKLRAAADAGADLPFKVGETRSAKEDQHRWQVFGAALKAAGYGQEGGE